MELGLRGRNAIITGASRGIGRAIAEQLAAEGVNLALCARGVDALRDTAERLRGHGVRIHAVALDVADEDALAPFVSQAVKQLGGLDILVSNASAGRQEGRRQWAASFKTDLLAFVRLVEVALPHLERSGAASVVGIGSTVAFDALPPAAPNSYGAAKVAVIRHAAALARELAPKGIRVNTVSPGPIEFPGGAWAAARAERPDFYNSIRSRVPLGRMGTPDDVARAVCFLASPSAAFCTGTNLVVDGGITGHVQS